MTKEQLAIYNSHPLDLFITRIWHFDLSDLEPHRGEWLSQIMERRELEEAGKGRSTRHGWSGPKTLFQDPLFASLLSSVHQVVRKAFTDMAVPGGLSYGLEAWANVHENGGFNRTHTHREALLSGCYYVDVPPGAGSIVFKDPRPGPQHARSLGKGVNSLSEVSLQPKTGALLLFPNWLEHSVEPNESEQARVSIAFNAVPVRATRRDNQR